MTGGEISALEQALIRRAQRGDLRAYEDLVRSHQDLAFRAAFLVTRDAAEAEDACQEAFVKAHTALGGFRDGAAFRPWLLKIVANEAKNRRRSAGRRQQLAIRAHAPQAATDPEEAAVTEEARATILAAFEQLSTRDRDVVGLRYLLDLSLEETAATLGIPTGTVKSRLSRALDRLEEHLGQKTGRPR